MTTRRTKYPILKGLLIFVSFIWIPYAAMEILNLLEIEELWPRLLVAACFGVVAVVGWYRSMVHGSYSPGPEAVPPQVQARNFFMRQHELRKERDQWEAVYGERLAQFRSMRRRIVRQLIPLLAVVLILVVFIIPYLRGC